MIVVEKCAVCNVFLGKVQQRINRPLSKFGRIEGFLSSVHDVNSCCISLEISPHGLHNDTLRRGSALERKDETLHRHNLSALNLSNLVGTLSTTVEDEGINIYS